MSTSRRHVGIWLVAALVVCCLGIASVGALSANAAVQKPAQVKSVSAKAASSSSIKVTWKTAKRAKGYKVRYSTNSKMKSAKVVTVKGAKKKTKMLAGLSGCTTYYVQVRAYRTSKIMGKWSSINAVKTLHALKNVAAKAPTCTEAGWYAYTACTKCSYSTKREIAATGHTFADGCCTICGAGTLDEYSWSELKAMANQIAACSSQSAARKKAQELGLLAADGKLTGNETRSLTLPVRTTGDGTYANAKVLVQILGFNHDAKADGSGMAGITFGFKEIVDYHCMNSYSAELMKFVYVDGSASVYGNLGGWEGCEMRQWLNRTFLENLPADLRGEIAPVTKYTNCVGNTSDPASVKGTTETVWLPCMTECYGEVPGASKNPLTAPEVYAQEGTQYQLYEDLGATATEMLALKKTVAGSDVSDWWWLRSPNAGCSFGFRRADANGDWKKLGTASGVWGVSPCFSL